MMKYKLVKALGIILTVGMMASAVRSYGTIGAIVSIGSVIATTVFWMGIVGELVERMERAKARVSKMRRELKARMKAEEEQDGQE